MRAILVHRVMCSQSDAVAVPIALGEDVAAATLSHCVSECGRAIARVTATVTARVASVFGDYCDLQDDMSPRPLPSRLKMEHLAQDGDDDSRSLRKSSESESASGRQESPVPVTSLCLIRSPQHHSLLIRPRMLQHMPTGEV